MLRAWALALSLSGSLASAAGAAEPERPGVPDFALRTLDGAKVRLSEHAGKVVLVSFWATWCSPCKQELVFLDELARKHAAEGLVVLAINTDAPKSQPDVRRFASTRELKIPVLLDADGEVAGKLNPRTAMPFTIYVDRRGGRAHDREGFTPSDQAEIEARVVALLKEPAPAP